MRAPRTQLMERAAYEFFAGRNDSGAPIWSTNVADRRPVIEDPNGARLASATFNRALGRYLLVSEHAPRASGAIGIFDAPDPWGPWTTIVYTDDFGDGQVPGTTFFANFAPKWWSEDGRSFVLAFTGTDAADSWSTVEGSLTRGNDDDDDDNDDGDDPAAPGAMTTMTAPAAQGAAPTTTAPVAPAALPTTTIRMISTDRAAPAA